MNNHIKAIRWLVENRKIPDSKSKAETALALHDTWCEIFQEKECNCQPVIVVQGQKLEYPKEILE